jgi:hypothetical protein
VGRLALTPAGWFSGVLAIAYSHLGDVTDVSMMLGGVVLFAAAPTTAFILAVYTARAGHRSGRIAVAVSGLLLLATLVFLTWVSWWAGLPVTGAAAVLVLTWLLSRKIAGVVSGLLLLAILLFSAWKTGGWINVTVIAVMAVAAVLVSAWVRSRIKPPPGPDGAQREEQPPPAPAAPGASGRASQVHPAWPSSWHRTGQHKRSSRTSQTSGQALYPERAVVHHRVRLACLAGADAVADVAWRAASGP